MTPTLSAVNLLGIFTLTYVKYGLPLVRRPRLQRVVEHLTRTTLDTLVVDFGMDGFLYDVFFCFIVMLFNCN